MNSLEPTGTFMPLVLGMWKETQIVGLAVEARYSVTSTLGVSRVFKNPDLHLLLPPHSHQAGVSCCGKMILYPLKICPLYCFNTI